MNFSPDKADPPERVKVKYFTKHAVERAFERYALVLSAHDMLAILKAIKDGRAQKMQRGNAGPNGVGGDTYIYTYKGTLLYVTATRDPDRIITFPPYDHFAPGRVRQNMEERRERRKERGRSDD